MFLHQYFDYLKLLRHTLISLRRCVYRLMDSWAFVCLHLDKLWYYLHLAGLLKYAACILQYLLEWLELLEETLHSCTDSMHSCINALTSWNYSVRSSNNFFIIIGSSNTGIKRSMWNHFVSIWHCMRKVRRQSLWHIPNFAFLYMNSGL
jgi:hypothetical protein